MVQLAMLGSIITNMIFVFGASCLIGGLHWQVQELRTPSGNVNVVMLLVATAGTLFPAALALSTGSSAGSSSSSSSVKYEELSSSSLPSSQLSQPLVDYNGVPSPEEVAFSRVNAAVMLTLYMCFLLFQLGTHKEEFDDDDDDDDNNNNDNRNLPVGATPLRYYHNQHHHYGGQHYRRRARYNLFCLRYLGHAKRIVLQQQQSSSSFDEYNHTTSRQNPARIRKNKMRQSDIDVPSLESGSYQDDSDGDEEIELLLQKKSGDGDYNKNGSGSVAPADGWWRRRRQAVETMAPIITAKKKTSLEFADSSVVNVDHDDDDYDDDQSHIKHHHHHPTERGTGNNGSLISMRVGVTWLFIITLCVSAITGTYSYYS